MRLNDLIEENYDKLNENDIYVWQYIYHHKRKVQQMSVYELAEACNISHTSIIRFAKKLGLDGFGELKFYIKWDLNQKAVFDMKKKTEIMGKFRDFLEVADHQDYEEIIKAIHDSRRIYIYATGQMQHLVAQELKRSFVHCHKIINVVEDTAELDYLLNQVSKDDYFIIISVSGNNEYAVTLAKALKRLNSRSLGIALGDKNMLSQYCTHYLEIVSCGLSTGYTDTEYQCSLPYYIIVNIIFLKYLEYTS